MDIDASSDTSGTSSPRPAKRSGKATSSHSRDGGAAIGSGATVLLIESDEKSRKVIGDILRRGGHVTLEALDGVAGLRVFYESRPDLVVFELNLAGLNGWQLLARIRELSEVPVMIVRSRGRSDLERVRALRSGADEVLDKPVHGEELLVRVDRLLRRSRAQTATAVYKDGFLQIDFPRRAVTVDGRQVALSPQEFRLLNAFISHPGEVLDHDRLRELVWGGVRGVPESRVKLYVSYLRKKLGPRVDGSSPIETMRGFGYMYSSDSGAPSSA